MRRLFRIPGVAALRSENSASANQFIWIREQLEAADGILEVDPGNTADGLNRVEGALDPLEEKKKR